MRIVRNRSHENFTVVANEVVNDHRLSFRALGLLVELLSKPDNWRTSASDLSRERKEGRDAVRAALGEIEAAGYLMRVKRQNSAGQWSTQWELFDRPQNPHHGPPGNGETGGFPAGDGFPGFGNPDAGEPDSGEPGPIARTESKDGDQRTTSAGSADAPEGQLTLLDDPSLPSVSAQRRRRRDLLWEAVLRVCGVDGSSLTPSARGAANRAVADLRAVGAEPDEVARRAAIFRATWPSIRLTPTALAKQWPACAQYVPAGDAEALRRQAEDASLIEWARRQDEQEATR